MRELWKSLFRISRQLTAMNGSLSDKVELQDALLQFPPRLQSVALEAASWPWQYRATRLTEMVKWDYSSEYGRARV